MSEENQHNNNMQEAYMHEAGDVAPKPSAVRRSGRINYARVARYGRPGLQPTRRMTPGQRQYADHVRRRKPPVPEPTPEDGEEEQVVDDDAIENMLTETFEDEEDKNKKVEEEKPLETPEPDLEGKRLEWPDSTPEAILDDKLFGYSEDDDDDDIDNLASSNNSNTKMQPDPPNVENDGTPDVLENHSEEPLATEEQPAEAPVVTAPAASKAISRRARRVYHRPHTNQTVVVGSKSNEDDSITSGLSQPSWTGGIGRRRKSEEDEDDDDDELSQTSLGNSKRRARMARRKKREGKPKRSSANTGNSKNLGYFVSQAFDNMLGYAGGPTINGDDESISTKGSEAVYDWQEAILSTLMCATPQHDIAMTTSHTFDDATTVESNHTGNQSRISTNSSVNRHVRSGSNLSGSIFSAIDGTGVGSVFSFETTEELADFSKNRQQRAQQKPGSYKVPDAYDPTPPVIPSQKEVQQAVYSKDLYPGAQQPDFAPVDLLSEGNSMIETVGKDLLSVASTTASGVFASVQDFLTSPTKSEEDTAAAEKPAEPGAIINTLSNVTKPLQAITENDALSEESPARRISSDGTTDEFQAFEQFDTNVFASAKSATDAEFDIHQAESGSLVFQGIDDQETLPDDVLPETKASQEDTTSIPVDEKDGEDLNLVVKPSEDNTFKREENITLSPSSTSIRIQGTDTTDTTSTSTEKALTTSISMDREEVSEPTSEPTSGPASEPAISEEQSEVDVNLVSPSSTEKPELTVVSESTSPMAMTKAEKTSFKAAVKAPEVKKSKKKKGMFKKLFSRSKKDKKGSKKTSAPSAPTSAKPAQEPKESHLSKSKPEENIVPPPQEVEPSTPTRQVQKSVPSPEPSLREIGAQAIQELTQETKEVTMEYPDPPLNIASSDVGDKVQASSELPPCPTTPVRDPEGYMDTPKMSNLEDDRKITRPVSGTNLADLPGICESKSYRDDPPATPSMRRTQVDPPTSGDDFGLSFQGGHVAGFEEIQNIETVNSTVSAKSFEDEPKEVSFDSFNLDFGMTSWESFGHNSADVGHAAFQQKLAEDANKASPQKVSAFPVC